MKRLVIILTVWLIVAGAAHAQSYSYNYERFFGKDDRIGLYTDKAEALFTAKVLQVIRNNTLLIDCGSQGKPSTAFIAKNVIYSAAHNLTLAQAKKLPCKIGTVELPNGKPSVNFKDNGMKADAAYDIASWPNITAHKGFKICKTLELDANYVLVQSLDGKGRLGVSPVCRVKSLENRLITTTCRGHYKASGGPLLKLSKTDVCVAGVFNAHSGKLFGYESYSAKLTP